MGLTQHENAVDNIKEIVNLLLLKGSIGKPVPVFARYAAIAMYRAIEPWAFGNLRRIVFSTNSKTSFNLKPQEIMAMM